jgi:hypothetical protein
VTYYRYKYRSLIKTIICLSLILGFFFECALAQSGANHSQQNLDFLLYEAGDTFQCRICRSPVGEIFFLESRQSGKRVAYLHFRKDSLLFQLDFTRKQYKKIAFTPLNYATGPDGIPTGRKKSLQVVNKTDTLQLEKWKADTLIDGLIGIISFRYNRWPAAVIPKNIIPEKIYWKNKNLVFDHFRLETSLFDRALFIVPGDFEERKSVYRSSPE